MKQKYIKEKINTLSYLKQVIRQMTEKEVKKCNPLIACAITAIRKIEQLMNKNYGHVCLRQGIVVSQEESLC